MKMHLLPETHARPRVERQEAVRVREDISPEALVEEAVGVELLRGGSPEVRTSMH